ncbi:MAG: phosphoglycerate mutase family protein [Actinomycetales bacterium]|nr:phosphoglycerate mutase family protein [Actinomycetales bacterium]
MSSGRRLVLWRHGRTAWNKERRIQGHADVPLDEVGFEQARRSARVLAGLVPTAIVCSDSVRAVDTAAALVELTGIVPTYDARLRETHLGAWEGLTDAQVREQFADEWIAWHRDEPELRAGGGETRAEVSLRVCAAIDDALNAQDNGNATLVVVSHGAALRVAMARLMGLPQEHWPALGGFANCAWSVLSEPDDPTTGETISGRWRLTEHNAASLPDVVIGDDS